MGIGSCYSTWERKKKGGEVINGEEFKQITDGLIDENNKLKEENEYLRLYNNMLLQNLYKMSDFGRINNTPNINENNINFVFQNGNNIIINISNLSKTNEVLVALKAQKPDLKDINHLTFLSNGGNITNNFKNEFSLCSLKDITNYPILIIEK